MYYTLVKLLTNKLHNPLSGWRLALGPALAHSHAGTWQSHVEYRRVLGVRNHPPCD